MSFTVRVSSAFGYLDGTMGLDISEQPYVPSLVLRIKNPPQSVEHVQSFVGRELRVAGSEVYVDGMKIADRNYTEINLVDGWMNILNGQVEDTAKEPEPAEISTAEWNAVWNDTIATVEERCRALSRQGVSEDDPEFRSLEAQLAFMRSKLIDPLTVSKGADRV